MAWVRSLACLLALPLACALEGSALVAVGRVRAARSSHPMLHQAYRPDNRRSSDGKPRLNNRRKTDRKPRADARPRAPTPAKANKFKRLCYGCGAELQTLQPAAAGFVEEERYALKALHKQLDQILCCRCRALSQGEILPAVVEGRLRKAGAEGVATPEQLRDELLHLRERKVSHPVESPSHRNGGAAVRLKLLGLQVLTVLLVDMVDVTGSFLPRLRNLIAGNPVVLVDADDLYRAEAGVSLTPPLSPQSATELGKFALATLFTAVG
ncbi:MAG: hypothetical protein SGPRY_001074 [Prymnesium sp.]